MVKSIQTSKTQLASTARSDGKPEAAGAGPTVQSVFTSAAVGMSWQLAVVVLLPVLGGYKLDQHLHSSPAWTLVGLVVAVTGSIFVIKRALKVFGTVNAQTTPAGNSDAPKKDAV